MLSLCLVSVAILTSLVLAACGNDAADQALAANNFHRVMGQNIELALDIFGPEDTALDTQHGKIYQWNAIKDTAASHDPNYDPDPRLLQCTISIYTRGDGKILHARMTGTVKSCHHFDEAINDHYPDYPNGQWINRQYIERAKRQADNQTDN